MKLKRVVVCAVVAQLFCVAFPQSSEKEIPEKSPRPGHTVVPAHIPQHPQTLPTQEALRDGRFRNLVTDTMVVNQTLTTDTINVQHAHIAHATYTNFDVVNSVTTKNLIVTNGARITGPLNMAGNPIVNISTAQAQEFIGTASPSAPAAVLTGDGTTQAPPLRLLGVPTFLNPSDIILAVDGSGNLISSGITIGAVSGGTSSNVPGTLVQRDLIDGGFAAGTMTANLIGYHTGNVSGDVIGNLSGAASANVLRTGDTMTGTLRIANPSAPALQLVTNAPSALTDFVLAIDSSGNVTQSNVQINALGASGTSGNVPNALVLRDGSGNFAAGTITAGLLGNVTGTVSGTVFGGLLGNVTGNVVGNLLGDVTGNLSGTVFGGLLGNVTGSVVGNLLGDVTGNVTGNLIGNVLGNVTGNVVGNVSGAASANVLKVGDTMTGQLRISDATDAALVLTGQGTTQAPAVRLLNNPPSQPTDVMLMLDAQGNLVRSTATISALAVGTSSNIPNTLVLRDSSGNFATSAITLNAGTTGFAAINQAGNTTTGLYFPAADSVALVAGALEQLVANPTGVGIGTDAPFTQLTVGQKFLQRGSTGTDSGPNQIFVQGRYAYVVNGTSNTLQVIDVTNQESPTPLGRVTTAAQPNAIHVNGTFAYIVTNSGSLQIIDVSNQSAPLVISTMSGILSQPTSIYVQGPYAYVVDTSGQNFNVIDVSNPSHPFRIGVIAGEFTGVETLFVQGRYAYVTDKGADAVEVIDLHDQQHPLSVGVVSTGVGSAPQSLDVQGRYAYAVCSGNDTFQVIDIGNPNNPTVVGILTIPGGGQQPWDAYTQGRYVYTITNGSHLIIAIDVSTPTNPQIVSSISTNGINPKSFYVQGRYAYVINATDDRLQIIDLGGAYIQQLETGGIEAGTLATRSDSSINGELDVRGGVLIGRGLLVTGDAAFEGKVTTTGGIQFYDGTSTGNSVGLNAPTTVNASYTLLLPTGQGTAQHQVLAQSATLGQLTWLSATSSNAPTTLVLRDISGNFAAQTITADVLGNVTGNVVGNILGNVTGNVTGNLLGDVTGNVVGDLSGAASENVLKTGDTMTGGLRIMNGTAPALQLLTNAPAAAQDYLLAIDTLGNVTTTTTQVSLLTNSTSTNVPNTLVLRDSSGDFAASTIAANLIGNVTGNVSGQVTGSLLGNVTGNVVGNILGDITGNVTGNLVGNVLGNVTGNVAGNLLGDVTGNVVGNVSGAASENVLKIGDTMTGSLRIMNATAPALQLLTNAPALDQDYLLAIDSSGNVTKTSTNAGLLTAGTSTNIPNTLVLRDSSGNFAASTITANLIGNVTGNVTGQVTGSLLGNVTGNVVGNVLGDVTGNVTGNLVGNVLGNVTGNVVGNLLGDVTGNVVGDVSGAASENVLKIGDTMTGSLRIMNATAPALQLLTNAPASDQDYLLAIDSSGNVTRTPTAVGLLTAGTSTNIPNTLVLRDSSGNFAAGTITANLIGNVTGNVVGNVTGSLLGNVTGNVVGNVLGDVTGNVTGNLVGNVLGNVTGNVVGNLLGDVTGNVVGDVSGAASENVLKIGDTMTGSLRIMNATAPALQLLTNAPASDQDYLLAIDSSGNVAKTPTNVGLLTAGTSSNIPNTLVLRDSSGNFAAGVITTNLVGNVTGNVSGQATGSLLGNVTGNVVGNVLGDVTGNVTGNLVGNVLGNVTGNVVGNLLGDVTGNVVGNVSGAASANVLKIGDTMTGQLRVSTSAAEPAALVTGQATTQAPALRLFQNPSATAADNILAIDSSGNVTQATAPFGPLFGGTSSNIPNTLVLRDGAGSFAANVITANGLDVLGTSTFRAPVYDLFANVSPQNILYVHKGLLTAPNQFSSVKSALAAITDASPTNLYLISVAPGVYGEDNPVALKPYVSIVGLNEGSVILQANDPNQDLLTVDYPLTRSFLQQLTLQGATGAGKAAIGVTGGEVTIYNIDFGSNDIGVRVNNSVSLQSAFVTIVIGEVLDSAVMSTVFDITDGAYPQSAGVLVSQFTTGAPAVNGKVAFVRGPGSFFFAGSLRCGSTSVAPAAGSRFLSMLFGALVEIGNASVSGYERAIEATPFMFGSRLTLFGFIAANNTNDIVVTDQQIQGSISGQFDSAKVSIDPAVSHLALLLTKPTDGGLTTLAPFNIGRTFDVITNVAPALNDGTNLGVLEGGLIYATPASLVVTVSAGSGYLMQTTAGFDNLKLVNWLTTTTTAAPNTDNFVYINNAGLTQVSLNQPSSIYTIPLGKVRTNGTGVLFSQVFPDDAAHTATKLNEAFVNALGAIYVSGSLVTAATGAQQINVTNGQYVFGTHQFAPVGGSLISWQAYLGAGTNLFVETQTSVDCSRFDLDGVLTPIPANYFARHELFVIGGIDSTTGSTAEQYALVYSQTVFPSLPTAEVGDLPTRPSTWSENIVPIASIIVSTTSTPQIAEILDERPRPGFVSSSVAGVTVHANLEGLSADDHKQYLLVNGTRLMTGTLNMSGNSIANAGTVNGVTVEAHASRHLPNNVVQDPIAVGTAVDVSALANDAGTANSLVRSDHDHFHGYLPGGALHDPVTITVPGFMRSADFLILQNATSSNTAGTLVQRDSLGNFAAGTITAGLIGNVTGNVVGNVQGNVTGSLLGNVTGNVAGNLLGNVTGNVVGNVSGAASANVLKIGDTMSGQLRINDPILASLVITGHGTTTAPAVRLTGNLTATNSDNFLAIDSSGNVSQTTTQIGALANATSSNVANTLVLRDNNGNFAAGTITAGLIGNVTGNVSGQVTGSLLGNVTGNVTGNLLGNVTGNVVGNVSGAASANVLKVGDTMTGQLRINDPSLASLVVTGHSTTTAPAVRLTGNLAATTSDNFLAIDSSGNVSQTTMKIGALANATSSNVANTLVLRDANGNFAAGTITAGLIGNVTGNVSGQVTGSLLGNVTGNVAGNLLGNVTGNVVGNVSGAASANVLKVGDTMTGQLRINDPSFASLVLTGHSTTTAPALRLFGNLTATSTNNFLAIDGSGNISQTTLQVGALANATSSNVANTLVLRDASGNFATSAITLNAGTTGAPALNFAGSAGTGLYSPGANQLALVVNTAQKLYVNSTGVGIGTTTPTNQLTVGDAYIQQLGAGDIQTVTLTSQANVTVGNNLNVTGSAAIGTTLQTAGDATFGGRVTVEDDLLLYDATGGQYVGLKAPTTVNASYTLTLPTDQGAAANQVLAQSSTLGQLTWLNATSSNTANTLVLRDSNNNFAAGTITANLIGNVTGNVAGNVLGNVTGNVVGNVSGAASANVLKVGDTMTGQLRINDPSLASLVVTGHSTTTAPALRLTGNLTATTSDNFLAIDSSGNVSQTTLQIGALANATSSNSANTLVLRDANGNFAAGTITAGLIGNVTGNVSGNVTGSLLGNVTGNVTGNLLGNVTGNVVGNVSGAASANVLKVGDTMTGQLRINDPILASLILTGHSTTTAPALRLTGNVTATNSDNFLAIDGSGNISQTALQVGALANATSSNVANTLVLRDNSGNFATSALTLNAGTTGALALNFSGSAGTGLYSPGTNQLALVVANAQKLYANNTGVGIGTSAPFTQLTVAEKMVLAGSTGTGLNSAVSVYVQGRYAYIVNLNGASSSLRIFDVSNVAAPIPLGSIATSNNSRAVFVEGRYAYVVNQTSGALQIIDVSNPNSLVQVGILSGLGSLFGVYVQGRYAYLPDGTNFRVIDVGNPSNPVQVGILGGFSGLFGVYVQGRYAYVTDSNIGRLSVIDIGNPNAPIQVGLLNGLGSPRTLYIQGRYAYVPDLGGNFYVIDVSNPSAPLQVGLLSGGIGTLISVFVQGRLAYMADTGGNIRVVDINNPTNPTLVDSIAVVSPQSIFIQGRYAYVVSSTSSNLFRIIDLGSAYIQQLETGGIETGTLATRENVAVGNDLDVRGGAAIGRSLQVTGDVALDGKVTITSTLQLLGNMTGVSASSLLAINTLGNVTQAVAPLDALANATSSNVANTLVLRDNSGNFSAGTLLANQIGIGTTAPFTQLVVTGTTLLAGSTGAGGAQAFAAYVQGRYAYVANNGSTSMSILDVSNPLQPTIVGMQTGLTNPNSISVQGRYAYVLNRGTPNTMLIVDISNPSSPVIVGTQSNGLADVSSVSVQGRYAYIVNYNAASLSIIDVSNPTNPTWVKTVSTGGVQSYSGTVQGRYAYVVNFSSNSLSIIDISDPTNAALVGAVSLGGGLFPTGVFIQGRYAYICGSGTPAFAVVDVSNPAAPVLVGSGSTGADTSFAVYVQGRYAYVTNFFEGTLGILDVSNPAAPTLIGTRSGFSQTRSIYVQGRYAYVGNQGNGKLQIVDLGGAYVQQLETGGIETGTLATRSNVAIGNDLDVKGGITIGRNLDVNGQITAINASGSTGTAITSPLCLVNLPAAASTDNLLSIDGSGNVMRSVHSFGGFVSRDSSGNITANAVTVNAGTVGAPAVTFAGSASTGLYSPGTNQLALSAAATQVLYANSTGVGIGAPTTLSQVTVGGNKLSALSTISIANFYVSSVCVQNRYAYIMVSGNAIVGGLKVIDISNPASMAIVGSVNIGAASDSFQHNSLSVQGNYAYVIDGTNNTFYIVDISNPAAPALIASIGTLAQGPGGIYVQGRYAYVGFVSGTGFQVFDVSNPAAPVSIATTTLSGSNNQRVFVQGRYAYVVSHNAGTLQIVDVSNPRTPVQISSVATAASGSPLPHEVIVQGRYAYVVNNTTNTLQIIDVSNPLAPVRRGSIGTGSNPIGLYIQDRFVYVISYASSLLQVFDVSNVASPTLVTQVSTAASAPFDLAVQGRYAFVMCGSLPALLQSFDLGSAYVQQLETGGIEAGTLATRSNVAVGNDLDVKGGATLARGFDATNSSSVLGDMVITNTSMAVAGSVGTSAGPYLLQVQGRYAYVTNFSASSLSIFDVSNPTTPVSVGSLGSLSNPTGLSVQGRYAYVGSNGANVLFVIDVSNPSSPVQLGSVGGFNAPRGIYAQGRFVYIANENTGELIIVDASNPAVPYIIGRVSVAGGAPFNVFVQGTYAYTCSAAGSAMGIIDVSNPAKPQVVKTLTTAAGGRIYVQGRYAYQVSSSASSLFIIDISNPATASIVQTVTGVTGVQNVYVQGNYAYLSSSSSNMFFIVDITTPTAAKIVQKFTIGSGNDLGLWVQGRYLYAINNSNNNLYVIDLGGVYIQQLEAGGIEAGTLATRENVAIGNDLDVKGGLIVGRNLEINGQLTAMNASGNTGMAATSPLRLVNIPSGTFGTALAVDVSGNVGVLTSSRRFKEHIVPLTNESDLLYSLTPVKYDYKPEYGGGKGLYGFIAEEVAQAYPTIINYERDGLINSYIYSTLHALTIKEVQKQQQELASHQKTIAALLQTDSSMQTVLTTQEGIIQLLRMTVASMQTEIHTLCVRP